jgi:DNA-binding response OmpR family regulator
VRAWVRALEEGADVCVTLYQHEDELAAQCAALARRSQRACAAAGGSIRVEAMQPIATVHGSPLKLTWSEHAVLAQLVKNLGQVVKREELGPQPGQLSSAALESLISRLRFKLPGFELRAVRFQGYVLRPRGAERVDARDNLVRPL